MLVNTYKNEKIHQHSTDNVCNATAYILAAMPTRQAGNRRTYQQTTFKYECFISTDDPSRRHSGNTAKNNY